MNKVYIIQSVETGKMVNNLYGGVVFEGEDGKERAHDLVKIHNRYYFANLWKMAEYNESEI